MASKKISGKIVAINDNANGINIQIETAAMIPATEKKTATPAKRVAITTNDPDLLRGLAVGETATISITSNK